VALEVGVMRDHSAVYDMWLLSLASDLTKQHYPMCSSLCAWHQISCCKVSGSPTQSVKQNHLTRTKKLACSSHWDYCLPCETLCTSPAEPAVSTAVNIRDTNRAMGIHMSSLQIALLSACASGDNFCFSFAAVQKEYSIAKTTPHHGTDYRR